MVRCFALALICILLHGWTAAKAQDAPEPTSPQAAEHRDQTDAEASDTERPEIRQEELPDTVVKGKRPKNRPEYEPPEYKVESSTMATKTDTPVLDSPDSVNVVTRDLLEDQDARTVEDIWRNVPGAHTAFGIGGGGSTVMRGFPVTGGQGSGGFSYPLFFNGLRGQPYGGYNSPRLYNVERVEVLKGPAAVLYGSGGPGGMVNMVSRKPEADFSHELDATVGSYDFYRTHVHSTGPITDSKQFLYLIDLGYEDAGSFRNNVETENIQFTTGFSWVRKNTRLDLEFGVTEDRRDGQPDRGIPCVNGKFFVLPRSFSPQEPSDFTDVSAQYGELHLEQKLADSLRLNLGLRAFRSDHDYHMHFPGSITGTLLPRTYMEGGYDTTGISSDTNLLWEVGNGVAKNRLLTGFEVVADHSKSKMRRAVVGVPALDIHHPVYGADPSTYTFMPTTRTDADTFRCGCYAQDQLELWKRLHFIAGMRYDAYDNEQSYDPPTNPDYRDDGGAMTFKGGVLYKLCDKTSVYASYGQSYEPQGVPRTPQPETFDPLEGWQVETGVKRAWLDKKLTTTVAWYFINRRNVLVSDPTDPMRLIMVGEQESTGVEMEVKGRLTRFWSVSANYAYTQATITEHSDPSQVGKSLDNVAKNQAGLWTRYDFGKSGFSVFGGINYVGKRPPYSGFLRFGADYYPAYTRVDAGASYKYKCVTVKANVNNVFDEEIALGGRGGYGYMPGDPRTFALSLSLDF